MQRVLILVTGGPLRQLALLGDQRQRVDRAGEFPGLDRRHVCDLGLARGRSLDDQHTRRTQGGATAVGLLLRDRDHDDGLARDDLAHTCAVAPHVVGVVQESGVLLRQGVREVLAPLAPEGVVDRVLAGELAGLRRVAAVPRDDAVERLSVDAVADGRPHPSTVAGVEVCEALVHDVRVGDRSRGTVHDDRRSSQRRLTGVPGTGEHALLDAAPHVVHGREQTVAALGRALAALDERV